MEAAFCKVNCVLDYFFAFGDLFIQIIFLVKFLSSSICTVLYCKIPPEESCVGFSGAAEGTACDSNGSVHKSTVISMYFKGKKINFFVWQKICIQGVCTKPQSPVVVDSCVYGDDFVTKNLVGYPLPHPYMTCKAFLDYVLTTRKESPTSYCLNSYFGNACCQTCKSE